MRRYTTFVVRILVDESNDMVGGEISHVGTQVTAYIPDLAKVVDFIQKQLVSPDERGFGGKTNGTTVLPKENESDTDYE